MCVYVGGGGGGGGGGGDIRNGQVGGGGGKNVGWWALGRYFRSLIPGSFLKTWEVETLSSPHVLRRELRLRQYRLLLTLYQPLRRSVVIHLNIPFPSVFTPYRTAHSHAFHSRDSDHTNLLTSIYVIKMSGNDNSL